MAANERGKGMREEIQTFIHYMEEEKQASKNTTLSYQRDLLKMADYLEDHGVRKGNKDRAEFLSPFSGKRGKGGIDGLKVPGVRKVIFWLDA